LLVQPGGAKTFFLHGRDRSGAQFKYKIGRFESELSAEAARAEAKRLRGLVALGRNPATERREARQAQRQRQAAPDGAQLWEACLEAHRGKWRPKTAAAYRSWIEGHALPVLGRSKAHEITPADIRKMYRAIVGRAPATADQVLRAVSSMFAWAVAQDDLPLITSNPCAGAIDRSARGPGAKQRDREPEGDELERMIATLKERGDDTSRYFLLLLLTGCREGELVNAAWRDFDLDAARPVWRKPTTKAGKPHRVTLSEPAVALLREVRQAHPFAPFSWLNENKMRAVWREVCEQACVKDLRIHDLRHWHASLLAAQGYGLLDIGKALGHRSEATSKRYTHMLDRRQREAAGKLGEVVRLAGRKS